MARRTRYGSDRNAEDPDADRPRRSKHQGGPPLLAIGALVVMIGGALAFARLMAGDKAEAAPETSAPTGYQAFSDLPREEPPVPGVHSSGGSTYSRAPSDLAASNPDWLKALETAALAEEIFAECQKAKAAGDHALFQEKGKLAKETYDEAFTLTALWEEELFEKYGEKDRQVREIVRTRTRWIDRVRVLHKTTGR